MQQSTSPPQYGRSSYSQRLFSASSSAVRRSAARPGRGPTPAASSASTSSPSTAGRHRLPPRDRRSRSPRGRTRRRPTGRRDPGARAAARRSPRSRPARASPPRPRRGSPSRSRSTCQRSAGSESSSHAIRARSRCGQRHPAHGPGVEVDRNGAGHADRPCCAGQVGDEQLAGRRRRPRSPPRGRRPAPVSAAPAARAARRTRSAPGPRGSEVPSARQSRADRRPRSSTGPPPLLGQAATLPSVHAPAKPLGCNGSTARSASTAGSGAAVVATALNRRASVTGPMNTGRPCASRPAFSRRSAASQAVDEVRDLGGVHLGGDAERQCRHVDWDVPDLAVQLGEVGAGAAEELDVQRVPSDAVAHGPPQVRGRDVPVRIEHAQPHDRETGKGGTQRPTASFAVTTRTSSPAPSCRPAWRRTKSPTIAVRPRSARPGRSRREPAAPATDPAEGRGTRRH